jgi:hypothetical protein
MDLRSRPLPAARLIWWCRDGGSRTRTGSRVLGPQRASKASLQREKTTPNYPAVLRPADANIRAKDCESRRTLMIRLFIAVAFAIFATTVHASEPRCVDLMTMQRIASLPERMAYDIWQMNVASKARLGHSRGSTDLDTVRAEVNASFLSMSDDELIAWVLRNSELRDRRDLSDEFPHARARGDKCHDRVTNLATCDPSDSRSGTAARARRSRPQDQQPVGRRNSSAECIFCETNPITPWHRTMASVVWIRRNPEANGDFATYDPSDGRSGTARAKGRRWKTKQTQEPQES